MSKVLLKSVILLSLLLSSIFTSYAIQQVNALPSFVTVTATNSGGTTILVVSNSIDSTSDVVSFILQINGGTFKSFKLENGWAGMKSSQNTLAFSAINPLKPGKTASFEIKTDQQIPIMTWKASDANNIEVGSGNINTQSSTPGSTSTPGSINQAQPSRGIQDASTFRIIPSTPSLGSHIRVVGQSFSPSTNLDLYIGNEKIGSLSSNEKGNFVSTLTIPDSEQTGSVNFLLKDQQGNQKSFTTNLKALTRQGIIQNVPLTVNVDPIFHRGETKLITGTATPGNTITFTIFDSKGNPLTTLTYQVDKNGTYGFKRTIPEDIPFGKYSVIISDGKNEVTKQFSIVTVHKISASVSAQKYEPGQIVVVNGTSISNEIVTFSYEDPAGRQIYSQDANVTSNGTVSSSYKLEDSTMKGTYVITVTQGDDTTLLYFGVGEDPSPPITVKMDKLTYSVSEKPVITVTGPSGSTINLVIVDPSDKQKFADIINLGPDGQTSYSFNLTAYTSGVYSAVVSHAEQKVEKEFAVGLGVGTGKIILNTIKDAYLPGDNIIVLGTVNPNTLLQISLTDPTGVLVKSINTFSDKTGHFSSFDFKIPPFGTPGTWKLDGSSGVNHVSKFLIVKSSKQGITISLDRDSGIYTRGDFIKISGTDAGISAAVQIKIGTNSTTIDTLPTSATNRGDYNTVWQVPRSVNPGKYTLEASSVTGKATISVTIQ